ncbi:acyltransferase domain-containing protein [Arthrobacter cryoconiti]|uniref:Acyltransferase domain-containing protein n=1 Tax=Arthrobacter cryoconiti TaxID=748907 RepID=A0ABV8R0A0_9MICC|nr:acyltransferase domain-containing protein [Arthrobacter cryoconiti]MCC9069876.1 acyltransferase domain-containing protein [Arthrobacter cryoconiti]
MIPSTALSPETIFDYLDVGEEDRASCLELLEAQISPAASAVQDYLLAALGNPSDSPTPDVDVDGTPATEIQWLEAMIRFVPALQQWHAERDIPDAVTRDTLADFGRHLRINRRVHGRFGMDTYKWLSHHFAGRIFQLGRLQYMLHQPSTDIPGVEADEWVLGIHIPEGGGLGMHLVTESLAQARRFFAAHFPEHPLTTANCESWLLDPYLAEHIDPESNIARFAALFTPYGAPRDEATDAVYFTFRTRSMEHLDLLPRTTALQQLVLGRIEAGGIWQVGTAFLRLPH